MINQDQTQDQTLPGLPMNLFSSDLNKIIDFLIIKMRKKPK